MIGGCETSTPPPPPEASSFSLTPMFDHKSIFSPKFHRIKSFMTIFVWFRSFLTSLFNNFLSFGSNFCCRAEHPKQNLDECPFRHPSPAPPPPPQVKFGRVPLSPPPTPPPPPPIIRECCSLFVSSLEDEEIWLYFQYDTENGVVWMTAAQRARVLGLYQLAQYIDEKGVHSKCIYDNRDHAKGISKKENYPKDMANIENHSQHIEKNASHSHDHGRGRHSFHRLRRYRTFFPQR